MIYCLNPDCENPLNFDSDQYCQCCGQQLGLLRNRYKILKPIGQGGFGKTFLAEDIDNFNEHCVIKQLICPGQEKHLKKKFQLFLREAKQLKRLNNIPCIPNLLAYFEENHRPYLVQEFIDGHNLSQELKITGTFSEEKIQILLRELLPILHTIHSQGIIHRDIKPGNIMRRYNDKHLILIDFGVAKQDSLSQLIHTGTILGTEGFAALEQFIQGKACPASDLFSLGVCCFNLLTDIPPDHLKNLKGYSWVDEWENHLKSPISTQLTAIIDRLLRIELSQRYTSAQDVLDDLPIHSFSNNNPIFPGIQNIEPFPLHSSDHTSLELPTYHTGLLSSPPSNFHLKKSSFEVLTVGEGQIIERNQQTSNAFEEVLDDSTTLTMIEISGGQYLMGSSDNDPQRLDDEGPQHDVCIAPFFIGKFLITQHQWEQVMGMNPSSFKGVNRPVEQVSWQEATEFCQRLSQRTGRNYRLPSESEWEFACRAGTTSPFSFGKTITPELANYDRNLVYDIGPQGQYRKQTTEVGSFSANFFGLHDMHGNVWEWCQDTWHDSYIGAPTTEKGWDDQGSPLRVLRGGAWIYSAEYCRSASRYYLPLDSKNFYAGFRVAMSPA